MGITRIDDSAKFEIKRKLESFQVKSMSCNDNLLHEFTDELPNTLRKIFSSQIKKLILDDRMTKYLI